MKNNLPNFLIAGVSKCGTSSLYHYLRTHPDIYFPSLKEPMFFLSNGVKIPREGIGDAVSDKGIIKDLTAYSNLFPEAKGVKRIGEATAEYVYYYRNTIKKIYTTLGDIPIIIIIRNPVDRAYSAYMHLIRDNREYLSFEGALKEEPNRICQNYAPLWRYTKVGFYYEPIKAYMNAFSEIKVYLFDDLVSNPLALVKDCFDFLEVDNKFIPVNIGDRFAQTGVPKFKVIYNLIANQNPLRSAIKPLVRIFINREKREQIKEGIRRRFLVHKPSMKSETRNQLTHLFRDDVLRLQELIDVDLSNWIKVEG